jgi:hypothetical protein
MQFSSFQIPKVVSYVLHPLLIPTFATLVFLTQPDLYSIELGKLLKIWLLSVVFVFTFGIPVIGVLLLLKFKAIQTIEMNDRGERTVPLLIAGVSFMALLFSVKSTMIPPVLLYVIFSAAFSLLAGLLINLVYKISLHTLGWGSFVASLTAISIRFGVPLLAMIVFSVLLSGIAGYARLKLNAHNPAQIYLGFVAGICVIAFIMILI